MEDYFSKPIPNLYSVRQARLGYRAWNINADAPQYTESCMDVRSAGVMGVNHYFSAQNPPYNQHIPGSTDALLVRETILHKLLEVNAKLKSFGLELFVFDALRPLAIQNYFHDVWFPQQIRERHPDWNDEQVVSEVELYWARGSRDGTIDPQSPPPHTTGAAVDVTLKYIDGGQVWMGTLFDDVTIDAHTDRMEGEGSEWSFTRQEARKNRRLLFWVMKEVGFENNPTEWWHFSYGDQMWAKLHSAEKGEEIPAHYSATTAASTADA